MSRPNMPLTTVDSSELEPVSTSSLSVASRTDRSYRLPTQKSPGVLLLRYRRFERWDDRGGSEMMSALVGRVAEKRQQAWRLSEMRQEALERRKLRRARMTLKRLSENPKQAQGLCLFYGNCKAEPARVLLSSTPGFPFKTLALPPVYDMTAEDAQQLRRILPHVAALVTHPVNEDYRGGMGLGSDTMAGLVTGQVIRMASVRYQGCFPFLVYIRHAGHAAPVTVYDDLRFLACASKGWAPDEALSWMREYVPPSVALREIGTASIAELKRREDEYGVDVGASDLLADPDVRSRGFFTFNHPTRVLLDPFTGRIAKALGVDYAPAGRGEPLGEIRPPIEASTYSALGLVGTPVSDWRIYGHRVTTERLLRMHLAAYAARPEVVRSGIKQHGELMARLELI
jgi:hypothetical protein